MRRGFKRAWRVTLAAVVTLGLVVMVATLRNNGGVWYIKEAKLPADWPALTPVGAVQVKQYPAYREAVVDAADVGAGQGAMFGPLFRHIQQNDIAMTAPVDLTYSPGDAPSMRSMSFLYDTPDRGPTGEGVGPVLVRDVEPITVVSTGVRGSYTDGRMTKALARLDDWLADHGEYERAGPPRYLGYNSPFVPSFCRYGEVQLPVRKRAD